MPWPPIKPVYEEIYQQTPILTLSLIAIINLALAIVAYQLIIDVKKLNKVDEIFSLEKLLVEDIISYLLIIMRANKSKSIKFDVDLFANQHRRKHYVSKRKLKPEINCSIKINSAICIAVANILMRKEFRINLNGAIKLEEIIIFSNSGFNYSIPIEVIKSIYLPVLHD